MYHDIVPLLENHTIPKEYSNTIPTVTDTGFPVIENDRFKDILTSSQANLDKAVNGFTVGSANSRAKLGEVQQRQRTILESYAKELQEYKNEDFPRAVDGRVVYSTPRQGGLQLGLTLLSQTQGFFGAGFFGNGFNP